MTCQFRLQINLTENDFASIRYAFITFAITAQEIHVTLVVENTAGKFQERIVIYDSLSSNILYYIETK